MNLGLSRLPKAWRWTGVAVLLLAGAAVGAVWADRHLPYYHFRTVQKGVFYRSSLLKPADLEHVIDDYGIKTVVNLRDVSDRQKGDWYEKEKAVADKKGIRHVDIPCPGATPPTKDEIAELLRVWDDPASRPILVHCEKGTLRSAAAEGLWRIEYMGETPAQARDRVTTWGRSLSKDAPKIADFLLSYVPRRDQPVAK